jgi:hypothetical protein
LTFINSTTINDKIKSILTYDLHFYRYLFLVYTQVYLKEMQNQTDIPRKSSKILSFSSTFRYLFSRGGSIIITFNFLISYKLTDLLALLYCCSRLFYLSFVFPLLLSPDDLLFKGILGIFVVYFEDDERSPVFC